MSTTCRQCGVGNTIVVLAIIIAVSQILLVDVYYVLSGHGDWVTNAQFSPGYLMKAGLAYELAGDLKAAKARYDKILKEFPNSNEVANAKRESTRLSYKLN